MASLESEGRWEPQLWLRQTEVLDGAREWSHSVMDALVPKLHPFLSSVRRETYADLPSQGREEATTDQLDLESPLFASQTISIHLRIDLSEPVEFDVDSFLVRLYQMADAYGAQATDAILAHVSKVAEAHNMTVSGQGREPFEVMIEALEKVEWGFDDEGNHQMSFVVGTELHEKLSKLQLTEAQEAQLKDLIDRKRKEWNASRRRSALP